MGCFSSKLLANADLDRVLSSNHVVSLTSSTYGVLNLDHYEEEEEEEEEDSIIKVRKRSPPPLFTPQSRKRILKEEPPEIINAWELMGDLNTETPIWSPAMKPAESQGVEITISPRKQKRRLLGKENSSPRHNPNRVLRPFSSSANKQPPVIDVKIQKLEKDWGVLGSRRSLSPLFNPELITSIERELRKEGEQIKKKAGDLALLLQSFEEKCPPGGEDSVVLYTTTLRGIRKTFDDCNAVRTTIESYDVRIIERDISMDSGFREELRLLMGKKEVRPPLVFVKGRLIGGAKEVLKLEEEGKWGLLLEVIPKKDATGCGVCGGVRFVMCRDCNGSCKVLDGEEKKMKCGGCNENGLIHCPMCC